MPPLESLYILYVDLPAAVFRNMPFPCIRALWKGRSPQRHRSRAVGVFDAGRKQLVISQTVAQRPQAGDAGRAADSSHS